MDLNNNDYVYIVETAGKDVYFRQGVIKEVDTNTLIIIPKQPDGDIGMEISPIEYYPKQKNIKITKDFDEGKMIYLAKKLRGRHKCDLVCLDEIRSYFDIPTIEKLYQEIEKSKSQYPEFWF